MIEITEREDNLMKEEKEDNTVKEEKKEIIMIEDPMSSEVTDRKEDMGDIKDSTVSKEREENMKEEREEKICMKTKSTPTTKDSKVIDLLDNMIDPLDNLIDHLDNMRDQDLPKVMNLMSIEEEEVQEEPEDKEVSEEEPEEVTETTSETENIMKETNTINREMTIENMAIEITKDTKSMTEGIDEEQ